MKTRAAFLLLMGLLGVVVSACEPEGIGTTGAPPVVQLMPELAGYRVVEGGAVQQYIASLAEGAALLAMNPEMLLLIEKVDSVVTCYQEAGAVNMRIYSDQDAPLSSGAIAIADRNRLTDPQTLFQCVGREINPFATEATVDPCSHSYTLDRNDNAFYIVYAGTTQEICQTFCSALEGCTGH